jgi:hypothetical protein
LLYDGSTIHNASDQFVSCVYFFFVDFAFHPSPQTKIGSVSANFKQLYLHTHWKLDTCLYELIYSEQSILPLPKIFTIPHETPCIYISTCPWFHTLHDYLTQQWAISTVWDRICTRQIQTAVSSHPLKIGHMFIWTYWLGIVHTTTSSWNTMYIYFNLSMIPCLAQLLDITVRA